MRASSLRGGGCRGGFGGGGGGVGGEDLGVQLRQTHLHLVEQHGVRLVDVTQRRQAVDRLQKHLLVVVCTQQTHMLIMYTCMNSANEHSLTVLITIDARLLMTHLACWPSCTGRDTVRRDLAASTRPSCCLDQCDLKAGQAVHYMCAHLHALIHTTVMWIGYGTLWTRGEWG